MILPLNKACYHDLNSLEILKTLVLIVVRRVEKYLDFVRSLDTSFLFLKIWLKQITYY